MEGVLELTVRLASGREVEAARAVMEAVRESHRGILAAFAAELVAIHEARTGSTVVVVTGSAQAERVLRELQRDQPAVVPTA